MARKAKEKVRAAEEDIFDLRDAQVDLENELKGKLDIIREKWETKASEITKKEIKPRRSDVIIDKVMLVWYPYWVSGNDKKAAVR